MSKNAEKPKEKKLPDRYPRNEKIIIFSDMGELDHVIEEIDGLTKDLFLITPESSNQEWFDLVKGSPVSGLMGFLRKACIEYEGFWQPAGWVAKDDADFMERLNDSEELHQLVCELEEGRLIEVNGKHQLRDESAYLAAARSLELAMYFMEMPGGKDWVDYCINQLTQNLTRYHAASLEIVLHRKNIYLINNWENIETARKSRERSKSRAETQKKEAGERANKALSLLEQYHKSGKYRNKTEIVIQIAADMKVKTLAVWRYLKGESITAESN